MGSDFPEQTNYFSFRKMLENAHTGSRQLLIIEIAFLWKDASKMGHENGLVEKIELGIFPFFLVTGTIVLLTDVIVSYVQISY